MNPTTNIIGYLLQKIALLLEILASGQPMKVKYYMLNTISKDLIQLASAENQSLVNDLVDLDHGINRFLRDGSFSIELVQSQLKVILVKLIFKPQFNTEYKAGMKRKATQMEVSEPSFALLKWFQEPPLQPNKRTNYENIPDEKSPIALYTPAMLCDQVQCIREFCTNQTAISGNLKTFLLQQLCNPMYETKVEMEKVYPSKTLDLLFDELRNVRQNELIKAPERMRKCVPILDKIIECLSTM